MADELGYYEPGFMAGRNIQTPHLDRMAKEGVLFKNLFAGSSVCADAWNAAHREAQRPFLGAIERRRHAVARGRNDHRFHAQAAGLRHGQLR